MVQMPRGSSPQVRGKPIIMTRVNISHRLIPAGAGKTSSKELYHPRDMAHPRRCGENFETDTQLNYDFGSSPQVRGKPRRSGTGDHRERLIPAGAGKTAPQRSQTR